MTKPQAHGPSQSRPRRDDPGMGRKRRRMRRMPALESLEGRMLLADGVLDVRFDGDGKATAGFDQIGLNFAGASAVAVQPDNKIVVAGFARAGFEQSVDFAVARFNPDGSLDQTFGQQGRVLIPFAREENTQNQANAVAIAPGGAILVAGTAQSDMAVARLTPSGELDGTFGTNGRVTIPFNLGGDLLDTVAAMAIDGQERIVLAGSASRSLNGDTSFAAARLNANGSLDSSFDEDGKVTVDFNLGGNLEDRATSLALQLDGKIVLGGYALNTGSYDFAATRLTSSGTIDTAFANSGRAVVSFDLRGDNRDQAFGVALGPNGRIALAGHASGDMGVVLLDSTGRVDAAFGNVGKAVVSFDLGGSNADGANAVVVQSDGKVVLGGFAQAGDAVRFQFAAARLTASGASDPTFGTNGRSSFDFDPNADFESAAALAQGPDSRLVLAGSSLPGSGQSQMAVAVLENAPPGPPPPPPPAPNPVLLAPHVIDVHQVRNRRGLTALMLTTDTPLLTDTAQNLGNYALTLPGRDRRWGTRDDRRIKLARAKYDGISQSINLILARAYNQRNALRLVVSTNVRGLNGVPLDGNADGQPGGDFVATIVPRGR